VIGAPPLLAGAVNVARTTPAYATTVGVAGCAGAVMAGVPVGVMDGDGAEGSDGPTALLATTVKVTALEVSPVIAHVVAPVVEHDPPVDAVTTYPVIGEPLSGGAVHDTRAALVYFVAVTAVGAAGTVGFDVIIDGTYCWVVAAVGLTEPTTERGTWFTPGSTKSAPVTPSTA
jgi:hypothetical protein